MCPWEIKSMYVYMFIYLFFYFLQPSSLPEYCYVDTKEGRKLNREMIEFQTWYKSTQKNK